MDTRHTIDESAQDRPLTMEELANIHFEPLEVNLDDVRSAYNAAWTDLAIAAMMMQKSPLECERVVRALYDEGVGEGTPLDQMVKSMPETAEWLRRAAKLVDAGELRVLAGMSRLEKALADDGARDGQLVAAEGRPVGRRAPARRARAATPGAMERKPRKIARPPSKQAVGTGA